MAWPPHVTLRITASVAVANALLNQLFVHRFSNGHRGSAWATGGAAVGVALG